MHTSDTSNQQWPDRLRKTTVDDRQIIKAVNMNPKICVCKITKQPPEIWDDASWVKWAYHRKNKLWLKIKTCNMQENTYI